MSWLIAAARTACTRMRRPSFCNARGSRSAVLPKDFRSGERPDCRLRQMAASRSKSTTERNERKGRTMTHTIETPAVDVESLRRAIQEEYAIVAQEPEHGFHFLVGRPLARLLGYADAWLDGIPEPTIASFAGTGNPFSVGELQAGEHVVDVGSGGGFDSLIAATMVGPNGHVIGVDMTPAMIVKARTSATA